MKETLECASGAESSAGFSPNGDFSLPPEAPYFSRAEDSLKYHEFTHDATSWIWSMIKS